MLLLDRGFGAIEVLEHAAPVNGQIKDAAKLLAAHVDARAVIPSGHEPSDRSVANGDRERPTTLNFTQDRAYLIAQLTLGNDPVRHDCYKP